MKEFKSTVFEDRGSLTSWVNSNKGTTKVVSISNSKHGDFVLFYWEWSNSAGGDERSSR
jgi:hypothetical protein